MQTPSGPCKQSISFKFCAALVVFAAIASATRAQAQHLIVFDAPGAGTSAYQGTQPSGINIRGEITGNVTDSNYGTHGFVRTPGGKFTEFDVPGADPVAGCTCPEAINDFGVVAGEYVDSNSIQHGFLRYPDGRFATFDAPGAGDAPGSYQGTWSAVINDFGVVAGDYWDANFNTHGYVRTPDGKITTFEDPSAGAGLYQGTWPYGINNAGAITGAVTDPGSGSHGFVRTANGHFFNFDFPGFPSTPSNSAFINDLGVIAGSYVAQDTGLNVGFERLPDGKMTTFQAPGIGAQANAGTNVMAMNLQGTTTGFYTDSNFENHSFVRLANGRTWTFSIPGQLAVPGSNLGSGGFSINARGQVAGRWHDANYAGHAYLWLPED